MKRVYCVLFMIFNLFIALFLCAFKPDSLTTITLKYENYSITYEDKYIEPTNHLVAEELYYRKINADLPEKICAVEKCLYAGADFKTAMLYSFPLLEKTVDTAIKNIDKEPENSKIIFTPNGYKYFRIITEKSGRKTDEDSLYSSIYCSLKKTKSPIINVTPNEIKADITTEDNMKLTNLRARFSTDYSASNENRKHNIRLALSKINGTILEPGDEFSFNETVGVRNERAGFKEAKIIVKGNYIKGYGGGVCQASTTLYNCALLADMQITMANNHSLQPSYVAPSFDAMVNSGSSDLKFTNSGTTPVFIRCYGTDTSAVVEFYGTKMPYYIQTMSEEIYKKDPPGDREVVDEKYEYLEENSESGTKKRIWYGKGETKSKGYLLYYNEQNELINKKLIRTDTYSATYGLIAIAP